MVDVRLLSTCGYVHFYLPVSAILLVLPIIPYDLFRPFSKLASLRQELYKAACVHLQAFVLVEKLVMLIDCVHMCLLFAQYQKNNSTDNRMDVAQTYCQKIGRSKTPSIISTHALMAVPILGQTQMVLVENMVLKSPMVYHALSSCCLLETVILWNCRTKWSFFPNETPNWSW